MLPAGTAFAADPGFTAERLVRLEAWGNMRVSPDGRWVMIERQGRYDEAATYAYGPLTSALLSDLVVVDTTGRVPDRVIGANDQIGYQSGPVSPDGRRMAVYRLSDQRRELGILTLETGEIRWFEISPQLAVLGRTLAWAGNGSLVVSATPSNELPLYYRLGWEAQAQTSVLWRQALIGDVPTGTLVPSGPGRDARPQADGGRLIRLNLQNGSVRTLFDGEVSDFELSPDGRFAAILTSEEDLQPRPGDRVTIGGPTRRRKLWLVEVASGRVSDLMPERDVLAHLLGWSSTGHGLLVFTRQPGQTWEEGILVKVDPVTATVQDLAATRPDVATNDSEGAPLARAVWLGDEPFVLGRGTDGAPAWRPADRSTRNHAPFGSTVRFGVTASGHWLSEDGTFTNLETGRQLRGRWLPDNLSADAGERGVWNPSDVDVGKSAVLTDHGCLAEGPDAPEAFCPGAPVRDEALVLASANGRTAVYRASSADGTGYLRIAAAGREDRKVVRINSDLAAIAWPTLRQVNVSGPDNRASTAWLLLPAGEPPKRGWPVVVRIYPGSDYPVAPMMLKPGAFVGQISPQVLANAGFAVLVPGLPNSGRGDLANDLVQRIDAAIQAATTTEPLDHERIALLGHSFGGHAALLAATRTDRYRAIIASAASADLGTSLRDTVHSTVLPKDGVWITGSAGWLETGQGGMGVPPWEAPEAYVAESPLYRADRINTPVMLVRGDLDPVGADNMFAALYRLNRDAVLLTYWGEGHNLASPANIIDLHERVVGFLEDRMKR